MIVKVICNVNNAHNFFLFSAGTTALNTLNTGSVEILCIPDIEVQEFDRNFGLDTQGSVYQAARLGGDSGAPDIIGDNTLACSLCETQQNTVVMIPARRTCPIGWLLEYEGVLMSSDRQANRRSSVLCVSLTFEPSFVTEENANGLEIVNENISCTDGNLCDAVNDNFDVRCVVCSK